MKKAAAKHTGTPGKEAAKDEDDIEDDSSSSESEEEDKPMPLYSEKPLPFSKAWILDYSLICVGFSINYSLIFASIISLECSMRELILV